MHFKVAVRKQVIPSQMFPGLSLLEWLRHTPSLILAQSLSYPSYFEQVRKSTCSNLTIID